jgi:hypothetical protein
MSLRTALIGATLIAVPLTGLIGLRPALADNSPACGALTKGPTCEQAGVAFRDALYQVSRTFTPSGGGGAVLCDGGPTANDRDTALGDNFWQFLIAEGATGGGGFAVSQVTGSKGRLVGYSLTGNLDLGAPQLTLFVTCVDDHLPSH